MYSSAPAWFVICGEGAPLLDGWRCYFAPTFHKDLVVVVERIPGLAVLRVHLPPEAGELFWEVVPLGGSLFRYPTAEDVHGLPHPVFEAELPDGAFEALERMLLVSTPEEQQYARDGMPVTTQVWRSGALETVEGWPPVGDHRAFIEQLLDLTAVVGEPDVRRRVADVRWYLR